MAANSKRRTGLSIVGFVFAMLGFVFLATGHTASGITMMAVGVVFIAAGKAAARKAPPPEQKGENSRHE